MILEDLVKGIIKEQSLIIGEMLAKQRATDSGVVKFNSTKIDDLNILEKDSPVVIERLVDSYKIVFGQASVEVCLNIIRKFPKDQVIPVIPETLKQALNSK